MGSQEAGVAQHASSETNQEELLRAQNALLEHHNEELLQVVLWSLAFAAVFLIAVLGLIGFFTSRRYDQEKEALRAHLDGQVTAAVAQLDGRLAQKADALRASQEATTKELREDLGKEADRAAGRVVGPVSKRLASAERDLANLQIEFIEQEAERWERQKVFTNAIRCRIKFVRGAKELDQDWRLTEGLDRIRQFLDAGVKLDAQLITDLHSLLTSLPNEYEPLVIKMKGLL